MKRSPKPHKPQDLLEFLLTYAKFYLGSGGPTSRLEDSLERIAHHFGHEAEVFATPTGIFITLGVKHDTASERLTALVRIRDAGTNLGRLAKLEHILADLSDHRISVRTALETIKNKNIRRELYSLRQSLFAAFLAGFGISFTAYQRFPAACISGAITAMIWFITGSFLKRYVANPIFTDFIGAFLTLFLAACAHALFRPLSLEAYALGGIVLLVPGLALTTAISELAEQNLVSGTAKFMQATLALLALGLAYLLFQQLAFALHLRGVLQPVTPRSPVLWMSALALLINASCFGVIFKVPPRALVWSTLTGLSGWIILQSLVQTRAAVTAPFLASVTVGIVSLSLGRYFRLPSQVYSVPGIIAMVPGMLALESFRYFASGNQGNGIAFSFQVAITAVSIVFGLMSARIPFVVLSRARTTSVFFPY